MTESAPQGPSLIKLGKLANSKEFDKLEAEWVDALNHPHYSWRELLPIAGQVGRQGAPERADTLLEMLIGWVEENRGAEEAFEAVRRAAVQLPGGKDIKLQLKRLFLVQHEDDPRLAELIDFLLDQEQDLDRVVELASLYARLLPGCFATCVDFLVPGVVESFNGAKGIVGLRFQDREAEFGRATLAKLTPRPADHFPSLLLYGPERLRGLAQDDPVEFIKTALRSQRENRYSYRDLKQALTELLGEAGWRSWWQRAKPLLKRDPLIGMSAGSQPVFRLLRRADRYEERLKRKFDHAPDNQAALQVVLDYLGEIAREEKAGHCEECADETLLQHFGNGAARIAVACLKAQEPALALAGLALHAEIAARGVEVAKPNPRAAAQVLGKLNDPGDMVFDLSESLLQKVLVYLRQALSDRWGEVWARVLARSGKRMCDLIAKGLLEGGQEENLVAALRTAVNKPTNSPDLLGWLWRTRHTSGAMGRFLAARDDLPSDRIAEAMLSLLDSIGRLHGMSMEEKHLKVLEAARSALSTQNNRPLLQLLDGASRSEALRLKEILSANAGLSSAHKAQLLGYLRSQHADLFVEVTREWEEPGRIYTTEPGLRRTEEALQHIVKVEIPQVARQIGEAASFGDLSENSEYTAALEKRDQLASRATRLETELAMAKVIDHEMAASGFVNIGTRVTVRPLPEGEPEVYTFLGPWDTDVDNRILNYQAPLAQAFMGAKVGDTVAFGDEGEERRWEIVSIEPAPGI